MALPLGNPGLLYAFCALGHPEAFFADLLVAGAPWAGSRAFRDHQPLGPHLPRLEAEARAAGATGLVCTEKDAVKLHPSTLPGMPLWIAEQRVTGAEPLANWILERLKSLPG